MSLGNVYATVWLILASGGTLQVSCALKRLLEALLGSSCKVYMHALDSGKGSVPEGVPDGKHGFTGRDLTPHDQTCSQVSLSSLVCPIFAL